MPSSRDPMRNVFLLPAAVALLSWGIGSYLSGRPPERAALLPELEQAPLQTDTAAEDFAFDHAGRTYLVEPVADYVLHGLVMSRNNPRSIADSYHDSKSVDTRDLCVVWGPNLDIPLHKVSVKNTSWMCWVRWPHGVNFRMDALSNNHLITDSARVREAIGAVRPGDQIRIDGLLVNYAPEEHPDWKRTSSTVRDDDGNGACEVVFVDEITVLRHGTPTAYGAASLGKWSLLLVVLLWVGRGVSRIVKDARVR